MITQEATQNLIFSKKAPQFSDLPSKHLEFLSFQLWNYLPMGPNFVITTWTHF